MIAWRLAWLTAAGLAALPPATGAEAACAGLEAVPLEIAVEVEPSGPPVIEAVAAAALGERAASSVGGEPGADRVLGGLTTATIQGEVGYTLSRIERADGTVCVALRAVTARLANRDVRVLLDARYPEGSCERRAILDHELQHVRFNAEVIADGGPALRRRLRAAAAPWEGRWVPEPRAAAIGEALQAALGEAVAEARRGADRRHAGIDTEASYARVRAACNRW